MYLGSIAALVVTSAWDGGPAILVVPLAIALAIVAGGAWSLIGGFLRVRYGTDEVLSTLMLNFIAILLLQWVVVGPLRDPAGTGQVAASSVIDPSVRISGWRSARTCAAPSSSAATTSSRTRRSRGWTC